MGAPSEVDISFDLVIIHPHDPNKWDDYGDGLMTGDLDIGLVVGNSLQWRASENMSAVAHSLRVMDDSGPASSYHSPLDEVEDRSACCGRWLFPVLQDLVQSERFTASLYTKLKPPYAFVGFIRRPCSTDGISYHGQVAPFPPSSRGSLPSQRQPWKGGGAQESALPPDFHSVGAGTSSWV